MFLFIKHLASLPAILSALSGLGLLILIVLTLFLKQKRVLITAALLLGAAGLAFLFLHNYKKKKPLQPMTSASMFKKMDYIEHLKLVSFYSEEIVVLGTKEKVQKIVDKLERQLLQLNKDVNVEEKKMDSLQQKINEKLQKTASDQQALSSQIDSLNRFKSAYKTFNKCSKHPCSVDRYALDKDDQPFYQNYQAAHAAFEEKNQDFKLKPWKGLARKARLKKRKELKEERDQMELDMFYQHKLVAQRLKWKLSLQETDVNNLVNSTSNIKTQDKKEKKQLEKWQKESRKNWEKMLVKRQKARVKLVEARLELEFAEESGEEIDPEVLIILPAEVSVFIDMKKLEIEGGENPDSLLIITIPEPEFDPVLIELPDSSAVYKLDGKKSEWVGTYQGAYYDLFGQLKEAILEKEIEVKEKAIENGLIEEGKKMAESYLKNFVGPLGYKIEFRRQEAPMIMVADEK